MSRNSFAWCQDAEACAETCAQYEAEIAKLRACVEAADVFLVVFDADYLKSTPLYPLRDTYRAARAALDAGKDLK